MSDLWLTECSKCPSDNISLDRKGHYRCHDCGWRERWIPAAPFQWNGSTVVTVAVGSIFGSSMGWFIAEWMSR